MKNQLLTALLLFTVFSIIGCSSNYAVKPKQNSAASLKSIELVPYYGGPERNKIVLTSKPKEFALVMPLIPGAIMGNIQTKPVMIYKGSIGDPLKIDLMKEVDKVSSFASPLLNTKFTRGLTIEPANAKIVRVGTFAIDLKSGESLGSTGLSIADKPKAGLILIYFDRPAVIKGLNVTEKYNVFVNLEAKSRGYIWAEVVEVDESHMTVTNRKLQGVETLYILAEDNIQT